jgi:allophanate hydrolase subunit 1
MNPMHPLPVGRDAVLVEVASPQEAVSLATWARGRALATDVVPGAETVLFDGVGDPARLTEVLAGWRPGEGRTGPEVEVMVTYDGPDLPFVAEQWGCPVEEVVARHQATPFVSAFCGFTPGFAYLSGLEHDVPRLATPRTRVPAGSVALAGRWCGVYPGESPGGWRVIGRTDAVLWDPGRAQPALLAPGVRVRFRDYTTGRAAPR